MSGGRGIGRPTLFLDRDGVINVARRAFVRRWEEFAFLPPALAALRLLAPTEWLVVVTTNQSCIGRGLVSLATLADIHSRMVRGIEAAGGRLDGIFFCPHHPDDGCRCRKPRPGLLEQACRVLPVDLERSWIVGDSLRDLEAGRALGVEGILVRTGFGEEALDQARSRGVSPLVAADLLDALRLMGLDGPRSPAAPGPDPPPDPRDSPPRSTDGSSCP